MYVLKETQVGENKIKLLDSQNSIDKKQIGNTIHLQIHEKGGRFRGQS